MKLVLKSVTIPDRWQEAFQPMPGIDEVQVVEVRNFQEASIRCREYIDTHALGISNWLGGQVFYNKALVAEVSHNGQVWTPGPGRTEIKF